MIIPVRKYRKKSFLRLVLFFLVIIAFTSVASFVIGKKGVEGAWGAVEERMYKTKMMFLTKLFPTEMTEININISFTALQKIETKRQEALERGILITEDDDFVNAEIRHGEEKIPVKLRLKGDWVDHLAGDKWSFRIHTRKDKAFMGMKRFSIQDPATRKDANEWVFLQALKQEGLITLRYQLIDVSINGEHKGIFALEEHFSKELLENNQRREAPILKFSEDWFWRNKLAYGLVNKANEELFLTVPIEPFRENRTLENELLKNQFLETERLLRGYRAGNLSVVDVFDVDQWATLFALSDLFGVRHGLTWHNLRFYPTL